MPALRGLRERLGTMPPHYLGGLYVATLTFTAIVQHYVRVLWLPLAALEILAFLVLFVAAAFLRLDEDVLLAAFLVSFSVGIALFVSNSIVGIAVHRSLGAVALSTPAFAVWLLIRGIIFVPLMALLIWVARRIQRRFRPPPVRTISTEHRRWRGP
jgi:hypothetical protein